MKKNEQKIGAQSGDPMDPLVEIELLGVTYKACMTYGAMSRVAAWLRARRTGGTLVEALRGIDFDTAPVLLWATLATHHPEIALAEVEKLVTLETIFEVKDKIIEAWILAQPNPSKQNPPQAAAPSA